MSVRSEISHSTQLSMRESAALFVVTSSVQVVGTRTQTWRHGDQEQERDNTILTATSTLGHSLLVVSVVIIIVVVVSSVVSSVVVRSVVVRSVADAGPRGLHVAHHGGQEENSARRSHTPSVTTTTHSAPG